MLVIHRDITPDNILVTGGLLPGARYDAVHINAEFAGSRPTDHDPQLALLRLGLGSAPAAAFAGDELAVAPTGGHATDQTMPHDVYVIA